MQEFLEPECEFLPEGVAPGDCGNWAPLPRAIFMLYALETPPSGFHVEGAGESPLCNAC